MNDNKIRWRPVALLAAVLLALSAPCRVAAATFFDVSGVVQSCNALACGAAGISVGDPISGYIEVVDAAAGPNSTFTDSDVLSFQLTVGDLVSDPGSGSFGTALLSTDADGEISSGTVNIMTTVDAGILGMADVDIDLDAGTSTWIASTTLLGIGEAASGSLGFMRRDSDNDGVADDFDNCSAVVNADQRDTNGDLFGNICDPDLDNNDVVNAIDLGLFKSVFFATGPGLDADFNGDQVVNTIDLGILKAFFFLPPGPSGPAGP